MKADSVIVGAGTAGPAAAEGRIPVESGITGNFSFVPSKCGFGSGIGMPNQSFVREFPLPNNREFS
jgi:hypothetical protein